MQTRQHDGNSKAHKCNHHLGQFFPASLKTEVVIPAPGAAQATLEDAGAGCAAAVLRSVALRKNVQSAKDGTRFLKLLFGWISEYTIFCPCCLSIFYSSICSKKKCW